MSKMKTILNSLASRMIQHEKSKIQNVVESLHMISENSSSSSKIPPQRQKVLNIVKQFESANKIPNNHKKPQTSQISNRCSNVLKMAKQFESKECAFPLNTNLKVLNNLKSNTQIKMKGAECRYSTGQGIHSNVSGQDTLIKLSGKEEAKVPRLARTSPPSMKIPSLQSKISQQTKLSDPSSLTTISCTKYVTVPLNPKPSPSQPPKSYNNVAIADKITRVFNLKETFESPMKIHSLPMKQPQPTKLINLLPTKPINVVRRFESTCGTVPFPPKPPLPPPPPPPNFPSHLVRPPCIKDYDQTKARFGPCVSLRPYYCPPERNSYEYSSFSENIDFVPSGEEKPWWYTYLSCDYKVSDHEEELPFKV